MTRGGLRIAAEAAACYTFRRALRREGRVVDTMGYWIFKVSRQALYPDQPGVAYVYDNTHSVRIRRGDSFIYLDKTKGYAFTGAGQVTEVESIDPERGKQRHPKVRRVFTARLSDVVWFSPPFDISQSAQGRRNRKSLALPADVNRIGWSISIPSLSEPVFERILDAALASSLSPIVSLEPCDWHVPDTFGLVKTRARMDAFRKAVMARHGYRCVVCGTTLRSVLQVAHVSPYMTDAANRANPANGLCLCGYCHAAFDAGDYAILEDGKVDILTRVDDDVALAHFTCVSSDTRRAWLQGVDTKLLASRQTERLPGRCASPAADKCKTDNGLYVHILQLGEVGVGDAEQCKSVGTRPAGR